MAMQKKHLPDGPILCQQAKKIVKHLTIVDFKASNGWLEKWKVNITLKKMKICNGESGPVSGQTTSP